MIAIDTSALIAITNHEPKRQMFLEQSHMPTVA